MTNSYGLINQITVTKQSKKQVETRINNLIYEYLNKNGWQLDQPIELRDFIEDHLGYKFELANLPEDILGCTYFESKDGKRVIIDSELYENNPKRANFTIAHEISHIYLHEKYYFRDKDQIKFDFITGDTPSSINRESKDPTRPEAERQADWGASYLLMPRDLLLYYWNLVKDNYKNYLEEPLNDINRDEIKNILVKCFTDELMVSKQALEIRIGDLGLEFFGFIPEGGGKQMKLFAG